VALTRTFAGRSILGLRRQKFLGAGLDEHLHLQIVARYWGYSLDSRPRVSPRGVSSKAAQDRFYPVSLSKS
jgi:hypothetical protein